MPRETLYARIDRRVDHMMQHTGFLDEVRQLLDNGHSPTLPAMSGVGYQELAAHLADELPLEESRPTHQIPHPRHRPTPIRLVPPPRPPHPLAQRHQQPSPNRPPPHPLLPPILTHPFPLLPSRRGAPCGRPPSPLAPAKAGAHPLPSYLFPLNYTPSFPRP